MATVVVDDPKATFSIATTPKCKGERYSMKYTTLTLILNLQCWVLIKAASSTNFLSLWYDSTWGWTPISRTIGKHTTY